MVSTSTTYSIPGMNLISNLWYNKQLDNIRNSGYGKSTPNTSANQKAASDSVRAKQASARSNYAQSVSNSGSAGESEETSSGSGITTENDAGEDVLNGGDGDASEMDASDADSGGTTSPLLEGSMSFEELIGEICDGLDLIFAVKRSTVVITDYESIFAEAKYLRDNYYDSVKAEDMALWQLEDGSYELDVAEYGFYNTVKVKYKNGTVTESYEDLVRVYGEVVAEYKEPDLDKSSAIMKAKAYLAAHVRDFDMTVKATVLHDGDIDIGDIVTLENPMTLRDKYRKETEKRDPEYFFVSANSVSWDGEGLITNDIEMRYGAESPERKEVPEAGAPGVASDSSSTGTTGDVDAAIQEIGKMAEGISYSGACQTHDCVQSQKTGDCFGMSDFIACELKARGVSAKIKGYPTYVPEHRSVLYKDKTGNWVRFPYRNFSIDQRFRDTDGVDSGHDVASTCGAES